MANRWTIQQEQAIDLHKRNLLVSAAAGSGKTAVLVERIVRMITEEDGIDVDQLLVLTFTRAAAMEMKERISARINRMLAEHPEHIRLKRQAALIGHANITTIDSFCLRVVRDYFGELDLDPDFRVGDEGELTLLQADCMAELLEQYYEEGNPDFLEFAEAYGGGKGDERLEEYIRKVYRFAQSCPYPEDWLSEASAGFRISSLEELEELPFMKFLKQFYQMLFQELYGQAQSLLEICLEPDGPYAYEEMMRSDLQQIQSFKQAHTMRELCICAANTKFVRKTTKRQKEADERKKAFVSSGRDEIKDRVKKTAQELSGFDVESILPAMQGLQKPMEVLLKLAADFNSLYCAAKAEKNILDFNDLEHLALSVLVKKGEGRTDAARELQKQFTEILVDEYQDSNYLQDMILESISGKEDGCPNMFMVGDVKQSIYRFRMARPEIFMDKYENYSKEDSLYQKIDLQKNFRSRDSVLDGINRIFKRIMTKTLGNIEYDADAALYPGAAYPEAKEENQGYITDEAHKALKLVLIDLDKQDAVDYMQDNQLEGDVNAAAAEAHAAAAEIRRITAPENGQLVLDKETGAYRRASYRDIVILLRSVTGTVGTYLDVLTAEGIPACALASGYFDALEVQVILSLLQIIDNPLQDIPLAAVMKSPVGNFGADELAEIASFYKKAGSSADRGLYPAIRYYLEHQQESFLGEKLKQFCERLETYREKADYLQVCELIQFLYQDTGYYDYVSAMPAGVVRRMNLDMLVEKAISYEKTSYHGLFHFVRYMEHLKKYEVDFEQGQAFGEQDDIVRIYSVHKSKGLEYPIVILGGMARKFNHLDSRSAVLLHPELGIAADYIDVERRCKVPSAAAIAIARRLKLDTLGEELRILYVAMTRARETLIMTAADSRLKKHIEQYEQLYNDGGFLPFHKLSSAGSYLEWIFMAAGDRLEDWMEIKKLTVSDVFTEPAVREAENISRMDELRQLAEDAQISEIVYDEQMKRTLDRIRKNRYEYEESTKIQSKFSVSELKRASAAARAELEEEKSLLLQELIQVPAFMKEENGAALSGTDRGTAYHRVLELLAPGQTWHTDVIKQEIEAFVAAGKIKPEAANQVNVWKLYEFYQSDLGKRVQKAWKEGKLYREQQFILSTPAYQVDEKWSSDEPVLIQGVIDACFEEDGKIILLDYKTDSRVTEEELCSRYRRQFELYRTALEQISGKKVEEMYLWSFAFGKALSM
ncbi:MAG: helicase-exonuclease AddAB subunit AddA [Lachnospiraceae bacterium]|nr:helicase-exonuclease AddAB subunit AddA [Lachnospiraceae bacterium]